MIEINLLAVLVTAAINMSLGFFWYGPLFGKAWTKLSGFTKEDMEKAQKEGMAKSYTFTILGALVMSYVLAHFISVGGASTAIAGATIGFWLWLGFIATTTLSGVLWGKKPFNLFILENGYYLVLLVLNGAILAVWK